MLTPDWLSRVLIADQFILVKQLLVPSPYAVGDRYTQLLDGLVSVLVAHQATLRKFVVIAKAHLKKKSRVGLEEISSRCSQFGMVF